MTRAGKAREWWTSATGLRCGGEKPRESACTDTWLVRRVPGHTLKWHLSLRKVSKGSIEPGASSAKPARWTLNHEAGMLNP